MSRSKTLLFAFLLVCLTSLVAFAVSQKLMSVQVRKGQVRSAPSFLGKVVDSLSYGDRVDVREEKGSWARVGMPGKSPRGWMHASALTKKKIVLNPGDIDVEEAASNNEIALAGKGFNNEVEKDFKAKNKNLNYAKVDKMEKIVVSQDKIQRFLKTGGLSPEGGSK